MKRFTAPLRTPSVDLSNLTDQLGQAWGVLAGEPLIQYLAWAEWAGIFSLLDKRGPMTLPEICENTVLNEAGADALTCILLSLKLLLREGAEKYVMSALAREYFVKQDPYYIGQALYLGLQKPLPIVYTHHYRDSSGSIARAGGDSRIMLRLGVQHSRNFGPSVAAARSGQFDRITHLVDIGGGSGVFAIPLSLDYPEIRVTLVDLPECLPAIRKTLARYGVDGRVELVGMDILRDEWRLPRCDGVLFGNLFHSMPDATCNMLCRKAFDLLSSGGTMWLHEVLFNDDKTGPMIAALWNANMRLLGGRQRTALELATMIQDAGFTSWEVVPTAGRFSLIACSK